jgi:hypothetical protein
LTLGVQQDVRLQIVAAVEALPAELAREVLPLIRILSSSTSEFKGLTLRFYEKTPKRR